MFLKNKKISLTNEEVIVTNNCVESLNAYILYLIPFRSYRLSVQTLKSFLKIQINKEKKINEQINEMKKEDSYISTIIIKTIAKLGNNFDHITSDNIDEIIKKFIENKNFIEKLSLQ